MSIALLFNETKQVDKCKICGGEVLGKSCIECGNIKGDIEHRLYGKSPTNLYKEYFKELSPNKQVLQILQEKKTKRNNIKIKHGNYESFSIEVDQKTKKIKNIRFHFKCIDGKIRNFQINITDYKLDKIKQRYIYGGSINIVRIKDLTIGLIEKKLNINYGNGKDIINYYKYLGLDFFIAKIFIEKILKDYHSNN